MGPDDFCNVVLTQLSQRMRDIKSTGDCNALLEALEKLDSDGFRLIIMLDDFDIAAENSNFDERFYSFLYSLSHRYKVACITASRHPFQRLFYSRDFLNSPFFSIFSNLYLGGLTEGEARELIVTPSESAGIPLEPYADFLFYIAGKHPFFLQIACSVLFEYLQAGNEFDYLGLEEVEMKILEEAQPHFLHIWRQMDEDEQEMIRSIIEDEPIDPAKRNTLRKLIQRGYVMESKEWDPMDSEQKVELFSYLFVKFAMRIIAETKDQVISELEKKVRERTRELIEKNSELEKALRQLKEAQSQLVIQEKMASLGNLVAGVAHEMNNPMSVIHSSADVANRGVQKIKNILKNKQDESQIQQCIKLLEMNCDVISTASDRVSRIVNSLKIFAKLDEALFQRVNIHENIDTTITLMYHEMKDKVAIVKKYGHIPLIQCYPGELNQMLMNLLRNAVQAIEEKGTVTINTQADERKVYIGISDTGKGISQEILPKIFDPGFTTRSGGIGTGLGLSIVYNIVQKHRGEIKVNSEIGKGTQVVVTLPIEQKNAATE